MSTYLMRLELANLFNTGGCTLLNGKNISGIEKYLIQFPIYQC